MAARRHGGRRSPALLGGGAWMLLAACSGGGSPVRSGEVTETLDEPAAATTLDPADVTGSTPGSTTGSTTSAPFTDTTDPAETTSTTSTTVPRFDVEALLAEAPMIGLNVIPPMPAGADLPLPPGMADFHDLFTVRGSERWAAAREHVDVFKLHAWQVRHFLSDDQLVAIFGYLDANDIPLMFETEPLPPPDPAECEHTESFEGPYDLEMARRIRSLGGTISLVAIEEPYHFAHKLDTPGACRYPVGRVVDEVIDYVARMREIFPGVPVGTIEPIWSSPATTPEDMAIWLDSYAERAGEPFAFLHLDPDWYRPDWAEVAAGIEAVADERGVPLGVLYNGGREPDAASWMQFLMEQAALLEIEHGVTPDHVLVQSWVDQPERALPDDDPAALTSAVVRYTSPRTDLAVTTTADGVVRAVATTVDGDPVPGAELRIEPRTLGGAFGTATLRGTVPDGATIAEVLVRANFEGVGPSPTQARISSISYIDGDDGTNDVPNAEFDAGLDGWGIGGDPIGRVEVAGDGADRWLEIEATSEQQIVVNGGGQTVTPGSAYELDVTYSITPEFSGSALVAVEFPGLARDTLLLTPPALAPITTVTGDDGAAVLALDGYEPGPYEIAATWAGDLGHWPARTSVVVELP